MYYEIGDPTEAIFYENQVGFELIPDCTTIDSYSFSELVAGSLPSIFTETDPKLFVFTTSPTDARTYTIILTTQTYVSVPTSYSMTLE
jgi:hypothetical protein